LKQPRYYHPTETIRDNAIANQACINEDMEQRRRLLDKDGEQQRKWISNKTAQLLKFTPCELKHVPWPIQAPLFVRHQTDGWHMIEEALYKASHFAEDTFNRAADIAASLGEKTVEAANAIGEKTVEMATAVGHATVEAASTFGHKTAEATSKAANIAQIVGHKTSDAAVVVSDAAVVVAHKTSDAAAVVSDAAVIVAHKTSDVAVVVAHKTSDVAAVVAHKTSDAAAIVAPLAAEIAHEAKCRLVHLKDDIVYSTTRKYVRALMEYERRRREVDFDEQYAILNALRVSFLFKELGCEFYRQSGQKFTYSYTLLEESERRWRQLPANSSVAYTNAKHAALLVKNKYFPIVRTTAGQEIHVIEKKVEIIKEAPPVTHTAYKSAM